MENEEFLKIVQQTRWQLLRLCERFFAETRTAAVAEDVVQETYLRLWQMRHKMKEFESPEALAVTIAKNICIDIRRKTPKDSIEIVGLDFAGGTSADTAVISAETMGIIERAMAKLPATQRRVLQLRSEDMSLDEISVICQTTRNSTKTILSLARRNLMNLIHLERVKHGRHS